MSAVASRPGGRRRRGLVGISVIGVLALAAIIGLGLFLGGFGSNQDRPPTVTVPLTMPDGDPEAGRVKVAHYGCASCHAVPGVPSVADGVGPALHDLDTRLYLAGQIPHRPEELIRWIRTPQDMIPGSLMPNTPMSEQDARDIAAYLYSR
ncbi:MAG: cytochrome c [Mobilicoccus sp.]|nr:cytochrome c [Mobilicoccus sp.]